MIPSTIWWGSRSRSWRSLKVPGLGLVAVDDQIGGSGRSEEAPLEAGREGGAAPAEKARTLDQFDEVGAGHRRRSPGLDVAIGRLIAVDGVAVGGMVGHAPGDDERVVVTFGPRRRRRRCPAARKPGTGRWPRLLP